MDMMNDAGTATAITTLAVPVPVLYYIPFQRFAWRVLRLSLKTANVTGIEHCPPPPLDIEL